MSILSKCVWLAVMLCGAVAMSLASGPAIGLVVANGSFEVEHSRVWGNATLFEGNVVETSVSASQLQLHNGVNIRLAAESRARVYQDKLVLEKGMGQLESANYRMEAAGLRVTADTPASIARVQLASPGRVLVAAREGSVRVANRQDVLVAKLERGSEMSFEPQAAGAALPTRVAGCLLSKGGELILVDQTTHVILQLQGAAPGELGNQVAVTGIADSGAPTAAGASQVINVDNLEHVAKGGCSQIAKQVDADETSGTGSAAAAGRTPGVALSKTATGAIVGGVAVAGTAGGLLAAGAFPGQGQNKPSNSR